MIQKLISGSIVFGIVFFGYLLMLKIFLHGYYRKDDKGEQNEHN